MNSVKRITKHIFP